MNYCVNHPDAAVTAYCQDCGRGLCSACTRTVQGNIYCEEHATARTASAQGAPSGAGAPGGMPGGIPGGMPGPASYPFGTPPPASGTNTGAATLLGFIPGVGAMYNGQYIKAMVHVVVFVILMGMGDRYWFFWLLLAFWVLYQVFDAHQTARARKYGLPLPDPFGLNELGNRIGGHAPANPPVGPPPGVAGAGAPGSPANPYVDQAAQWGRQADVWGEQVRQQAHQWGEQAGQWGEQIRAKVVAAEAQARAGQPGARWGGGPVSQGFTATATPPPPGGWAATPPPPPGAWSGAPGPVPPVPPVPPMPPFPQVELERARREPIGAIVLIILGMLFLLNTMGFFSFGWVGHGWPLVVVAIAVWLLMRNARGHMGFMPHMGAKPGSGPGDATQDTSASQHENQPGGEK